MSSNAERIRERLAESVQTPRQLIESIGISQPSLSRAMAELGESVVRLGAARSIQYALRDTLRGLPEMPVHRVDAEGHLRLLGCLIPVRPEGFVMRQEDGRCRYSEGLPWCLADMRPVGYLGRAYAGRYGGALGLPARLSDWSDTDSLRALLAHGQDLPGNLLVGERAREEFLASPAPRLVEQTDKARLYPQLAGESAQGERPGFSAGGEQPKFTAYAETESGARHVLVKFSEAEDSPVSERWRDLLLFEHLALTSLSEAGVEAARSRLIDAAGQRFLEVERFDRVGESGRRALHSLAMLEAEFVGAATGSWPEITRRLAEADIVSKEAISGSALLWAFGSLIGNTDMHNGNLSFCSDHGRPYALAPAYDMTAMAFAPRSGGGLPEALAAPSLRSDIAGELWRQAEALARNLLARLKLVPGFSQRFMPCIAALDAHLDLAAQRIARLG